MDIFSSSVYLYWGFQDKRRRKNFNYFTCCTQNNNKTISIKDKVVLVIAQDKYIQGKITITISFSLHCRDHGFVLRGSYSSAPLNY